MFANSDRHYGAIPLLEVEDDQRTEINNMAQRRWHLAYTLLRNPQLIELRRRPTNDCPQISARGGSVISKNVDLKLTSKISITEDYQV